MWCIFFVHETLTLAPGNPERFKIILIPNTKYCTWNRCLSLCDWLPSHCYEKYSDKCNLFWLTILKDMVHHDHDDVALGKEGITIGARGCLVTLHGTMNRSSAGLQSLQSCLQWPTSSSDPLPPVRLHNLPQSNTDNVFLECERTITSWCCLCFLSFFYFYKFHCLPHSVLPLLFLPINFLLVYKEVDFLVIFSCTFNSALLCLPKPVIKIHHFLCSHNLGIYKQTWLYMSQTCKELIARSGGCICGC